MKPSRRELLSVFATTIAASNLPGVLRAADDSAAEMHIATNTYPWLTFARRNGEEFVAHADQLLADIQRSGIRGYEPIINSPAEFEGLGERLKQHQLEMRSIYVNSVLHDPAEVDASIESVVQIAAGAKALGASIVVTNPAPIRWGGPEDKTDPQLRLQARSLDRLGARLRDMGVTLAYHNHDAELRQGAREFHHMLTATDPEHVKFCLDSHWVYRGCGNSEVAVFDALTLYADRIVELHLRQSNNGIWTESFAIEGDIDYSQVFDRLDANQILPHLVLEQSVESASTNQMSAVAAHSASREHLYQARS